MKIQTWVVSVKDRALGIYEQAHAPFTSYEAAINWARVNLRNSDFQVRLIEKEETN